MSGIKLDSLNNDFKNYFYSVSSFENSLSLVSNPKPFYLKKSDSCFMFFVIVLFLLCVLCFVFTSLKNTKK